MLQQVDTTYFKIFVIYLILLKLVIYNKLLIWQPLKIWPENLTFFVKLFLEIFPVFIQIGNSKSFFYYFSSVTDRILFKILKRPKPPISLHDRNFWDHEKSELNFRLPMY